MIILYSPQTRKSASIRTPFIVYFTPGHAYASSGVPY